MLTDFKTISYKTESHIIWIDQQSADSEYRALVEISGVCLFENWMHVLYISFFKRQNTQTNSKYNTYSVC